MNFVINMMNFVINMMNFVINMMNFVTNMMDFVINMMNFVLKARQRQCRDGTISHAGPVSTNALLAANFNQNVRPFLN